MPETSQPPAASVFDAHHPPAKELIDKCVHCGFCLQTCPTYLLWGEEMDSPRGRIYLMSLAADGAIGMNRTLVQHMDRCLGCMACVTACPSAVPYGKLIEATRAQIERHYPRSTGARLFRHFVFGIFTNPGLLRILAVPLWIYQRSGLQSLVRTTGLVKILPKRLRSMESLLPQISLRAGLAERMAPTSEKRRRVGLMLGCVQRVFLDRVNAATARVLAAEGCEVIAPESQPCCGALMIHAGEERQALDLARRMIDAFERADVDTVVVNAAGCGSTLKDYGYLLRDDPQYAERAQAFSAKCKDISEILAELKPRATRNPLPLKVAYHDSCHLQHAQGIKAQPRAALATIPGLQVVEVPEGPICCGSAGIYNLVQPETAEELGERKARNVISTAPDVVATGNPGCLFQLQRGLHEAGHHIPVLHMIELLDASIRGESPTQR